LSLGSLFGKWIITVDESQVVYTFDFVQFDFVFGFYHVVWNLDMSTRAKSFPVGFIIHHVVCCARHADNVAIDLFYFHVWNIEKDFMGTLSISPGRIFVFFVHDFVDCALQCEDFHLVKSFFFYFFIFCWKL
jgi:hypothetical protein